MSTAPFRGWVHTRDGRVWKALSAWGRGTRAGMEQRNVKAAWRWHTQEVERVVETCIVLLAAAADHGWRGSYFGPVHHDRVTPLVVLVD
jgi:hypothetical protein